MCCYHITQLSIDVCSFFRNYLPTHIFDCHRYKMMICAFWQDNLVSFSPAKQFNKKICHLFTTKMLGPFVVFGPWWKNLIFFGMYEILKYIKMKINSIGTLLAHYKTNCRQIWLYWTIPHFFRGGGVGDYRSKPLVFRTRNRNFSGTFLSDHHASWKLNWHVKTFTFFQEAATPSIQDFLLKVL